LRLSILLRVIFSFCQGPNSPALELLLKPSTNRGLDPPLDSTGQLVGSQVKDRPGEDITALKRVPANTLWHGHKAG
jgi:hypothetical protein